MTAEPEAAGSPNYLPYSLPHALVQPHTMDEGTVEPLDVVVAWQREQHLVADDGERQE